MYTKGSSFSVTETGVSFQLARAIEKSADLNHSVGSQRLWQRPPESGLPSALRSACFAFAEPELRVGVDGDQRPDKLLEGREAVRQPISANLMSVCDFAKKGSDSGRSFCPKGLGKGLGAGTLSKNPLS
jgi:hypothetical protein